MIRGYLKNQRGAAAVEFALMLGVFLAALPSAIDLGIYAYDNMQVKNSAQMAVQAVWQTCGQFPVTKLCSAGSTAASTAAQQTSLTTNVSVTSLTEGFYCTNSSGALYALTTLGTYSSPLSTSSVGACANSDLTTLPADYVTATVTYTYSPVFASISVASLLGTTITGTSTMRML
jgi:Flp pilus assembly protein TadG